MNIYMIRENGAPIPQYPLSEGFVIETLGAEEGDKWERFVPYIIVLQQQTKKTSFLRA